MPVDISKDDTVVMKKGPAKPEDISKDDTVVMKKAPAKPEDISKDDTVVLKKAPAKPVDISKDDTNVIKEAPVGISKENTAAKTKTSSAAAATKSTAAPKAAEPATPSPDNTEVLIKQPVVPSSAGAVSSSVPTSSSEGNTVSLPPQARSKAAGAAALRTPRASATIKPLGLGSKLGGGKFGGAARVARDKQVVDDYDDYDMPSSTAPAASASSVSSSASASASSSAPGASMSSSMHRPPAVATPSAVSDDDTVMRPDLQLKASSLNAIAEESPRSSISASVSTPSDSTGSRAFHTATVQMGGAKTPGAAMVTPARATATTAGRTSTGTSNTSTPAAKMGSDQTPSAGAQRTPASSTIGHLPAVSELTPTPAPTPASVTKPLPSTQPRAAAPSTTATTHIQVCNDAAMTPSTSAPPVRDAAQAGCAPTPTAVRFGGGGTGGTSHRNVADGTTAEGRQSVASAAFRDDKIIMVNDVAYTVVKTLGKGGTSHVFKVFSPDKEEFALKQVKLEGEEGEQLLEAVRNEIELMNYVKRKGLGLKWEAVGTTRPSTGTELSNGGLCAALQEGKVDFSEDELIEFGLAARAKDSGGRTQLVVDGVLQPNSFVAVGEGRPQYFKPCEGLTKYIIELRDSEIKLDEGVVYMVMECGEVDLAGVLKREYTKAKGRAHGEPAMAQNNIVYYWEQMLQAVHAIHEARVIHGDLKPANFLLVAGELKLIDFGIAKTMSGNLDNTKIDRENTVGTVNYMSPEAIFGDESGLKQGRASDVWSLGCILYQMVHGTTPFYHIKNIVQKMQAITNEGFKISYPELLNVHLTDVIKACLQRKAEKRPSIPSLLAHPLLRGPSSAAPAPAPAGAGLSDEQLGQLLQQVAAAGSSVDFATLVASIQTTSSSSFDVDTLIRSAQAAKRSSEPPTPQPTPATPAAPTPQQRSKLPAPVATPTPAAAYTSAPAAAPAAPPAAGQTAPPAPPAAAPAPAPVPLRVSSRSSAAAAPSRVRRAAMPGSTTSLAKPTAPPSSMRDGTTPSVR